LIRHTKLKIKKVSFRSLSENLTQNVNYCWLVLHFRTICINYGV